MECGQLQANYAATFRKVPWEITAVCNPDCEGCIRHYQRFLVIVFISLLDPESAFYSELERFTLITQTVQTIDNGSQYPHTVRKFV
jgi:hypothetical protein